MTESTEKPRTPGQAAATLWVWAAIFTVGAILVATSPVSAALGALAGFAGLAAVALAIKALTS